MHIPVRKILSLILAFLTSLPAIGMQQIGGKAVIGGKITLGGGGVTAGVITVVRRTTFFSTSSGTANTITSTTGNCIVVGTHAITSAVTDSHSDSFIQAGSATDTGGSDHSNIWYFPNATPGITSITATWTSGNGVAVWELSGASSSCIDGAAAIQNNGTATTSGSGPSVTPGISGDVVIGAAACANSVNSVSGGFGNFFQSTGGDGFGDLTNATSSAQTPVWAFSASSTWDGVTVAFRHP